MKEIMVNEFNVTEGLAKYNGKRVLIICKSHDDEKAFTVQGKLRVEYSKEPKPVSQYGKSGDTIEMTSLLNRTAGG